MAQALRLQRRFAATVERRPRVRRLRDLRLIAGADAAYCGIEGERLVAAVVVLALPALEVIERAWAEDRVTFPYIPGLLGFRAAPVVLRACARLRCERLAARRASGQLSPAWLPISPAHLPRSRPASTCSPSATATGGTACRRLG